MHIWIIYIKLVSVSVQDGGCRGSAHREEEMDPLFWKYHFHNFLGSHQWIWPSSLWECQCSKFVDRAVYFKTLLKVFDYCLVSIRWGDIPLLSLESTERKPCFVQNHSFLPLVWWDLHHSVPQQNRPARGEDHTVWSGNLLPQLQW